MSGFTVVISPFSAWLVFSHQLFETVHEHQEPVRNPLFADGTVCGLRPAFNMEIFFSGIYFLPGISTFGVSCSHGIMMGSVTSQGCLCALSMLWSLLKLAE